MTDVKLRVNCERDNMRVSRAKCNQVVDKDGFEKNVGNLNKKYFVF